MTTQHIVALSGGKDSTAMALRLSEIEPHDYQYVVTPTGNEPTEMLAHWERLEQLLGKPLIRLGDQTLEGLIKKYKALPNWRMRWCTRQLKIEPFNSYLLTQCPAISYVGLRSDEPAEVRRGTIFGNVAGIEQRFPLREWGWGITDVWGYLNSKGITIPERTDCNWCFFQTLGEWWTLWSEKPEEYARAEAWEIVVGHTFRSPQRDTWPASLKELRHEFEKGRVPKLRTSRKDMCRVCSL